jgi:hypothetical protein
MTSIPYELVEKECIRFLALKSGKSQSYISIFNRIVDSEKISSIIGKNLILLNELKLITYDVVRHLSTRQKNIKVHDMNGTLYAYHYIDDSDINLPITMSVSSSEETVEDNSNINVDVISVIEFILSNKIYSHYYRPDYLGNTMLHNLIIANRLDYIKKYFSILIEMIDTENNEVNTPIILIKDLSISNFFLDYLFKLNKLKEKELIEIINIIKSDYNKKIKDSRDHISYVYYLFLIQFFINVFVLYMIFS